MTFSLIFGCKRRRLQQELPIWDTEKRIILSPAAPTRRDEAGERGANSGAHL